MFWKGGEALTTLDSFVVKLWPQTSQRPGGTWAQSETFLGSATGMDTILLSRDRWSLCDQSATFTATQKRKQCYALSDSSQPVVFAFQSAGSVGMVSLFVNLEHLHEFKSEQCLQAQGQFTKWLIDFLEEGCDVLDSPTEYFYWSPRQPKVRGYLATFYHCS